MAPLPEHFAHPSRIHGQGHVSRVIIHALVLADALGMEDHAVPAWAAAHIHDLGRRHDGRCREHGRYALDKLAATPELTALLVEGGVKEGDWEGISVAVENHCRAEIPDTHPHRTLTAILKDADGLDRVRLRDLNPGFLRFPVSRALVPFAEALYKETNWALRPGPGYFGALWSVAQRLLSAQPPDKR